MNPRDGGGPPGVGKSPAARVGGGRWAIGARQSVRGCYEMPTANCASI